MPYIGRDTDKLSNIEVLDNITFDGSSSYTLQKGGSNFTPSSANTLLLSIDGVVQAGNFTVSGSTIDFGTAVAGTSTCDFILHYGIGLITAPADGTVTTAKLADSSVSLAKLTATGTKDATTFLRGDNTFGVPPLGGITVADQWRLTADKANVDTNFTAFDSNLERVDTGGQGTIGSAMSFETGTGNFTFPANGIYLVKAEVSYAKDANRRYTGVGIKVTTNNSNYTMVAEGYETINPVDGNNSHSYVSASSLIDVSNFNNVKVRFGGITPAAITALGNTTVNLTCFTFIRLGDT
jgi:hypothetical protein